MTLYRKNPDHYCLEKRLMFRYVMTVCTSCTLTFIWRLSVFDSAKNQQWPQQAGNREASQNRRFCAIWRTLKSPRTLFKSRLPHKWKACKQVVCELFFVRVQQVAPSWKACKHDVCRLLSCLRLGGDLTCRPVVLHNLFYIKLCKLTAFLIQNVQLLTEKYSYNILAYYLILYFHNSLWFC